MIYFTQLIYLKPGQEKVFDEFEAVAMPLIARYQGDLILRMRPPVSSMIEGSGNPPYEIHVVSFPGEAEFQGFAKDPERASFLHLKEASVERIVLIRGSVI